MSDSIWKKEISLRRKPKPTPTPSAPPAESTPKQSIWKKEISLGRKKPKAEEAAAPPPVAIAPQPGPAATEPEPVAAPESEPTASEEPLPHAAGDYEWLTYGLDADRPSVEVVPPPMPENVYALSPAPEEAAAPEEAPAPEQAPAPEAPPPAGAATASDVRAEKPQKTPKPPKPSLLKREISLGRKGKRAGADKAEAAPATDEPKPARQPRSGGRGPKLAPRGPKLAARGKQVVGLKVGASQIAAARVANNGTSELLQVARAELPPGVVVGGELRDPDALAEILRAFFRDHKLPKRGVRLGISNNRIGVRTFEIVGIEDPKQLANAVRFRAQEELPIPIEDTVLDFRVLAEGRTDEGEPTRRVLLVVAYRDLVDRYVAACRKAGLTLAGIDLEAFALLRSLSAPRADGEIPDAAFVAVAIGHERSTLAVSDGRVCEFTRVVEWGGFGITVAIARALDVGPAEAEPVKRALSLDAPVAIEGLSPEQVQAAEDAARRQIHTFGRELVSSLQFYQGQPGSLGIGEIVVTGGTAHLPGLAAELERLIGVSVRIGDPLARVRVGRRVAEPEQSGSLAVAIGLGIED